MVDGKNKVKSRIRLKQPGWLLTYFIRYCFACYQRISGF
jgi:hypothetical protein